jgi:hypothetical protein
VSSVKPVFGDVLRQIHPWFAVRNQPTSASRPRLSQVCQGFVIYLVLVSRARDLTWLS